MSEVLGHIISFLPNALKDPGQEGGERHPPRAPLSPGTLLLPDEHGLGSEVHVEGLDAEDLRASAPGVGGEAERRVDPSVPSVRLGEGQELVDLGQAQEQAVPKLRLLRLAETAEGDPSFDLLPGLKGGASPRLWGT
jgi:hypothetical protein